ncbi:MAG: heparinase II/III family protein, partial [Pirellulaceae bacterium]
EGLSVYHKQSGWSRAKHNWNQVCNGGLGVGALALADVRPELAAEVLHEAVKSLPLAMHEFAPDGGWGEGPGYWRYATEYNVYFLAALQTSLGSEFGLAQLPGFSVTGDFPLHFTGPTGLTFNYADAHDGWRGAPQLFWLATEFRQPAYAAAQLPLADRYLSVLDFVWGARYAANPPRIRELPLDRHFQNVSVVTLRSDWRDERSIFVGFKGGDNRVNHGQLDLGSFVLDALGVRWAIDLGPDDYNIPGYFGKQRWSYYRNSTLGHNALTFGEQNQSTTAQAPILQFASSKTRAIAVADLSAAYPEASEVLRGIALLDRQRILVQDEIHVEQPRSMEWHLHTPADVQISGNRAMLTEGTQRLSAVILAPDEARFTVQEATTVPPQRPLRDVRRLSIHLPVDASAGLRLAVLLEPGEHRSGVTPPIVPLEAWPQHE